MEIVNGKIDMFELVIRRIKLVIVNGAQGGEGLMAPTGGHHHVWDRHLQ